VSRDKNKPDEVRGDSFSEVERRIEVTRRRLPGYPLEHARLARLITHIQKLQAELCNAALKPYELNYVTYTALMMLYGSEQQTLTPSELSNATGEKPTNVTRICDELLQKGLIERYPSTADRRRVVLRLSGKGERLVGQFQPKIWQTLDRLYSGYSKAELQQITALLRRPLARLDS
jgi:MarR family transcriptional regulator, negative regulator of the multidrug operon emrRAB